MNTHAFAPAALRGIVAGKPTIFLLPLQAPFHIFILPSSRLSFRYCSCCCIVARADLYRSKSRGMQSVQALPTTPLLPSHIVEFAPTYPMLSYPFALLSSPSSPVIRKTGAEIMSIIWTSPCGAQRVCARASVACPLPRQWC